jgi:hypothetical protein
MSVSDMRDDHAVLHQQSRMSPSRVEDALMAHPGYGCCARDGYATGGAR